MKKILLFIIAYVTMYGATGNVMANGKYPLAGAVACPRSYALGTKVKILDITFVCSDHTALRYDGRFDIFSTGTTKQMLQFGKKKLEVEILN